MVNLLSQFIFLLTGGLIALLVVGCGGTDASPDVAQPAIGGPAFVLFFTDN
ncbi:MAG: hypothetical protein ACPG8W_00545 [Candidatus Promineifilaceae bacterium]